jgi:hypothetical protein
LNNHHLSQFQPKLAELEAALAVVLDSLAQLTSASEPVESSDRPMPAPVQEQAFNPAATREVLTRLRQQVAGGDLDSVQTLRHLEEICGSHFRAELKTLGQLLDAFNFDEAGKVVQALETRLREA